jgi:carbon monoxide dehydrogenase subunit G
MKITGEFIFDGTRDEVWKLFRDPEVLATALPGTQKLNKISETEYEGEINIRVGPIVGTFSGHILVSNEIPPESCTLTVEGSGKAGFLNGSGDVQFFEQGKDQTLMKYEGEAQIGGKLASVGQRLLDVTSKSLTKKGLETINQTMQERRAKK